jgi:hypothetical protein
MSNDTKFLIKVVIWVIAIILFVYSAMREGELRKKMRPENYGQKRFSINNNL